MRYTVQILLNIHGIQNIELVLKYSIMYLHNTYNTNAIIVYYTTIQCYKLKQYYNIITSTITYSHLLPTWYQLRQHTSMLLPLVPDWSLARIAEMLLLIPRIPGEVDGTTACAESPTVVYNNNKQGIYLYLYQNSRATVLL